MAYARIFLILCLINLVVGCAKQNGAIKARPNEIKLIIGETTKEDLIGWFGAQSKVIALENGNETHEFVIKGNNMKGGVLVGSVTGGTLTAIVAMFFTIPIVVLAVRFASRRTMLLERSVFVVFSLPHITIAIAVVAFTITWLRPIYQTMFVLVFVYAAMFIAVSTSAAKATLLQVDPAVDDASRSLGRGPFATLTKVTVPLMSKGLLAGGALVFVTTIKELPVTLLLSPPGFSTLAVRTWAAADELLYSRAATAALILITISVLPVYYLTIKPKEVVRR